MINQTELFAYASYTVEEIFRSLVSQQTGLTPLESQKRIVEFGYNSLVVEKKRHVAVEYLLNFKNPLIIILLFVVTISFLLGETIDAMIVTMMVFLSVTLNFYQEHRASAAAEKLQNRVAHKTIVIRNGEEQEIFAKQVVPGDVLLLNAGDLIPADARVFEARDLFVNQSSLTGESYPVEKITHPLSTSANELPALTNIIFSGTSVITGSAKALVLKTGGQTEFGKIAQKLLIADDQNEFTRGVGQFSVMILRIIVLFVLFVFFANAFIKQDILEALSFAIAIAVGLTPEFLPMIMTVTMSKGSQNMAKKGVIVKKLTAIPTFGSMEILCTDKTGTLTEDKITLIKYLDAKGNHSEQVLLSAFLNSSYQTGITNPMDKAILEYKKLDLAGYTKVDEIPFDFERKKMSVVTQHGSDHILITKGAPEEIFKSCSHVVEDGKNILLHNELIAQLHASYETLSADGFRVLAIAQKPIADKKNNYTKADEKEMTFVGFAAFLDPAKQGVKESITDLEHMGIEIKVITGDNELVAKKICTEVGIHIKGILLGHEIGTLTQDQLYTQAMQTTIFARFSPAQKEQIILVLKKHGRVVGYMGDGINDAPSLKAADVGISVSNSVDVAKESAAIILTNKSLHELKNGVIEGRKTFSNTMKYVMMGVSSNFGNMFSVLGAVLFLPFLPMLPIQILLNNFLYDIGQITIPSDHVDTEFVQRPKRWDMKFIRNFMLVFGPISSLFDFLSFFVLYMFFQYSPGGFQTGWFMESLATQTLVIHVIRTKHIPFVQSRASSLLTISTFAVVITGWILPYTSMGRYFGFSPLPLHVVGLLLGIVVVYLITTEIGKRIFYSRVYGK